MSAVIYQPSYSGHTTESNIADLASWAFIEGFVGGFIYEVYNRRVLLSRIDHIDSTHPLACYPDTLSPLFIPCMSFEN